MTNRLKLAMIAAIAAISALPVATFAQAGDVFIGDEPSVFSPDRKHVAFIRSSGQKVETGLGECHAGIVLYGNSRKTAKPLFEVGHIVETKKPIGKIPLADLSDLAFSNDGKTLYFLGSCYATSGALFAVDVATHKVSYVTDSNSLQVIRSGKHRGELLITKHRYRSEKEGLGSFEQPEYIKPH